MRIVRLCAALGGQVAVSAEASRDAPGSSDYDGRRAANREPDASPGTMPTFDFAAISQAFSMEGEYRGAHPHGNGHIHDTFLFTCEGGGRRYLVQRVNERVFRDAERVMHNISIVTRHLHAALAARGVADCARRVLTPVQSREGRLLHRDASGCWRAFDFIEGTHGFDRPTGESMAYEAARAFGEFARDLADLPPARLTEILPAFHHTPTRYVAFERALGADPHGRVRQAGPEIAFARARRALAEIPSRLVREGQIPWRVTHNDTKLDNVLFDEKSGAALCVVDLDTVMPGLSLYDFGDLVRSAAHRAAEDTTDLDTVGIEIPLFAALVAGYLAGTGGCLTPGERDHLGFAGQIVALETGLRFLSDYLLGDVYFKTDREHHNLERCRVQFRLVESIEARMAELEDVVRRAGR